MSHTKSPLVLAIDFGTSNSLLAAASSKEVFAPIPLDTMAADPTVLRSVLFTPERNKWFFGDTAISEYQQHAAEGRLFRSIKKYLPDASFNGTKVHNAFRSLVDLIATFLKHMRETANKHFDTDCTSVVLGRPALFSSDKAADMLAESRLEEAARLAGFTEITFLPEPVAAAYEFRHRLTNEQNVLIADFGGGTSDFTVLRMGPREMKDSDVLAIGGVSVAGDMFDGSIMRHMIAPHFGSNIVYRLPMGSNDLRLPVNLITRMCSPADMSLLMRSDLMALLKDAQRWSIAPEDAKRMNRLFTLVEDHLGYALFRAIEQSKISLSSNTSSRFQFDYPEIEVSEEIFSSDFKVHSQSNVDKIIASMDETVRASGISYENIDVVCCTGGTAKIPALRYELIRRLGKEKLQEHRHFHSVVGGLAEKAHALIRC